MAAAGLPKIDAPRSYQSEAPAKASQARGSQSARSARQDSIVEKEKWKAERRQLMERLEQEARARHALSKQLQMREEGVSRIQAENSRTVERLQMQIHSLRNSREDMLVQVQEKDRALEEERSFRFALETRIADLLTDGLQVSERLTTQDILEFTGLSRIAGAHVDSSSPGSAQTVALRQPQFTVAKKLRPALDGCCCACHVPPKWEESIAMEEQNDTDLPHFLLNSRESSASDSFKDNMDPSHLITRLVSVWRNEKMEAVANARAQREALDQVCSKLQEEVARLQNDLSQYRERDREHEAAVARLEREAVTLQKERDRALEEAHIMTTQNVEKASANDKVGSENDELRRAVGTLQHERDFLQSQVDQMGKKLVLLKGGLAWKGQFQQVLLGLNGMMDIFKEFESKITFALVELGNRITKLKLRLDAQEIMRHNNAAKDQVAADGAAPLPPPGGRPSPTGDESIDGSGSNSFARSMSNALCWKHVVLEDPRDAPLVLAELDLKNLQQKSLANLFKRSTAEAAVKSLVDPSTGPVLGTTRETFDVDTRIEAMNFAQCVLDDTLSTKSAADAYVLWSTFVKKHVLHADVSTSSGKSPLSKESFAYVVKAALAALYEQFPGMSLASFQHPPRQKAKVSPKFQKVDVSATSFLDAAEKSALDEVLELQGVEAELVSFRRFREKSGWNVKESKNWIQAQSAANQKVYGYALGLPGRPGLK